MFRDRLITDFYHLDTRRIVSVRFITSRLIFIFKTSSIEKSIINGDSRVCLRERTLGEFIYIHDCRTVLSKKIIRPGGFFRNLPFGQLLIMDSSFWLVNTLLKKFNTSLKKEIKMIKKPDFPDKKTKEVSARKVAFFTLNLLH